MPESRRKRDRRDHRGNLFRSAVGVVSQLSRRDPEAEAAWERLPLAEPDPAHLRRSRIVTADRADTAHAPFDMLRTQILQTMRERGWRSLAVTSPAPGCGKTLVCLNLAFSFARQRQARIALVELDLRRPSMGRALGLHPPRTVADMLVGDATPGETMLRAGEGLALALADRSEPDSAEILHHETCAEALAEMADTLDPDVTIYDLPPMLAADDAEIVLAQVDCALLVAAANESRLKEIDACETRLEALTASLGVALNKCEFTPMRYYGYGSG